MRTTLSLLTLSALALPTQAATVLIDGTTRNGSFSNLEAGAVDDGDVTFAETVAWTNVGTGPQAGQAIRNTPAGLDSAGAYLGATGGYNAVVPETDARRFGNDTGHTVGLGDSFDLSYHWIDAFNWDDASDQIAVRFYTTSNDDILGPEEDFLVLLSGTSTTSATYQEFSQSGISLPASFNGDRLFVVFYGEDGNAAANGFARVDDFSLSVIPEPSTLGLAGLAALGFLRRRR